MASSNSSAGSASADNRALAGRSWLVAAGAATSAAGEESRWTLAVVALSLICSLLLLAPTLTSGDGTATYITRTTPFAIGNRSVSLVDDAAALWLNPAALGRYSRTCGQLGYTKWDDRHWRGWNFSLSAGGFGFGFDRLRFEDGEVLHTYALGLAFPAGNQTWMGASTTWLRSDAARIDNSFRLNLGLLVRPTRCLSVGVVGRDITEEKWLGERLTRSYVAGLGVRPMTTRLSLTADAQYIEGTKWEEVTYGLGLQAEPYDGVVLSGSANFDEDNEISTYTLAISIMAPGAGHLPAFESDKDGKSVRWSYNMAVFGDYGRSLLANKSVAEVEVKGPLGDSDLRPAPISFFGGGTQYNGYHILEQLRRAREDDSIKGVLLKLNSLSGRAVVQEIGQELEKIRSAGKPIVAYADNLTGIEIYRLAAKADVIIIPEGSLAGELGLSREIMMVGALLDSIGIEWDRSAQGKYKTYGEPYGRYHLTEAGREALEFIYTDIYESFVEEAASDRGMTIDEFRALADGRIMISRDAKEAGLIDEIGTYEDAAKKLGELVDMGEKPRKTNLAKRHYRDYEWAPYPKIGVIWADGGIHRGKSTGGLFEANTIGSDTVNEQLKKLREDSSVKAVVLRVDSGGGDGLASALMWSEVKKYKEDGKPIVVSMGRVAASAGYHISAPAAKIYASPGTITGSIGLVAMKPALGGLVDKLHLNVERFDHGKYAGILSAFRHWTEEERRMVDEKVMEYYRRFLGNIGEGRGMSIEEVDEIAQGRVWTGQQAKDLGLVDELGGFYDSIEEAKQLAGIVGEVTLVHYGPPKPSFFEKLAAGMAERFSSSQSFGTERDFELVVPIGMEEGVE